MVAEQVPGARFITYDGSAHGLFATDKERLIGDVREFLIADDRGTVRDTSASAIPLSN